MRFSDIQGLAELKEKFCRTIQDGKVAHAQLFSGPEGSGSLALAIAYASMLNCTNRNVSDSCGMCPSCTKMKKLIHPDVHFVFPVAPVKEISGKEVVSDSFITDWREFIIDNPYADDADWLSYIGGENKQLNISREESRNILKKLSLKAYEGEYKIMIIWLAEYMHTAAANALLKLLEEPPDKTVFLMVTRDSEQIIGTILSRVQHVRVRPFNNEEVASHLSSNQLADPTRAAQVAAIAGGSLNYAIKLIENVEEDAHIMFRDWMRICFMNNYVQLADKTEEFGKSGKLLQKGLLQYGLSVLRDILLKVHGQESLMSSRSSTRTFVDNFSGTLLPHGVEKMYDILNSAYYHLERNANARIVFLDSSLQLSALFKR